jgi:hypothetical protein
MAGNKLEQQSKQLRLSKGKAVVAGLEDRGNNVGPTIRSSDSDEERRLGEFLRVGRGSILGCFRCSRRSSLGPVVGELLAEDVGGIGGND